METDTFVLDNIPFELEYDWNDVEGSLNVLIGGHYVTDYLTDSIKEVLVQTIKFRWNGE